MLVVVDMGNTNITMGLFKDDQLIGNYRLTTKLQRTSDEYGFMILAFLSAYNVTVEDIKDVIISSVVPKIMYSFTNSIRKYFHKEPIIVGPGIKTGISVKYDNPKSLGTISLLNNLCVPKTKSIVPSFKPEIILLTSFLEVNLFSRAILTGKFLKRFKALS